MTTDIQTIARGEASRILEPQRTVARTEEQWRAIWEAHAVPGTAPPLVDFASRMVVAVFQGQQPSAGFDTSIAEARVDGSALSVRIDEGLPTSGRMAAQVLVSPYHIVSMPRFDGVVQFEDAHQHARELTQASPAAAGHDFTTRAAMPVLPAPSSPSTRAAGSASSTGLSPETAGALAYLAGPLSGALLLILERTSGNVRFHAWQALIGLGSLALTAIVCLGLAFVMLIVSPRVFSAMLWVAAVAAVAGVALWAICLVQAYKGRQWKMPFVGARAERLAAR